MEVEENVFFCRQVSELKEGVGGEEFDSKGTEASICIC